MGGGGLAHLWVDLLGEYYKNHVIYYMDRETHRKQVKARCITFIEENDKQGQFFETTLYAFVQ